MSMLRVVPDELQGPPSWEFAVAGTRRVWDLSTSSPPVSELEPIRKVASSRLSRHVPVLAYSMTTGGTLALESGLELELMSWLDRQSLVTHLVSQPAHLEWEDGRSHTPDLLSMDVDGVVTLWDARATEAQDADFALKAAATRRACGEVGWRYEVFAGLSVIASLNLRWLGVSRRAPEWLDPHVEPLRSLAEDGASIGDVAAADGGRGYLLSSMWHLVWRGDIQLDLEEPWCDSTPLAWAGAR